MKPYIFTERNGIHIIDLQQTVKLLNVAYGVVRDAVANGGTILFVGTKRQAQETIRDEAMRCGMPYVTERWLGGMLTNWSTMYARIQELERLEQLRDSGEIAHLTKKEGLMVQREIDRLLIHLSGVREMKRVPELLFVVDIGREEAAVHEANLLNIPVVALVDTNCNPQKIDYVIPSNDDAIRAIKLLVGKIADAALEGAAMRKDEEQVDAAAAELEGGTETARPRQPVKVVETEEEPEEGALLGEATLAKLSAARQPEEPPAAAEQAPATETTEEPAAASAEETAAQPAEAAAQPEETKEPDAASPEEPAAEPAEPTAEAESAEAPADAAASDKSEPAAGGQEPETS